MVTDVTCSRGVGPALVKAYTPDEAKHVFAAGEGSSVDGMESSGLTWWSVDVQPDSKASARLIFDVEIEGAEPVEVATALEDALVASIEATPRVTLTHHEVGDIPAPQS
ncbi:hypothetical protein [Microbacterium laevaniformans]|uniref:hypothetical protein n=1 Tax=Microbacterium laevaniformans TaxID=36807 RepID=UPI003D986EB5